MTTRWLGSLYFGTVWTTIIHSGILETTSGTDKPISAICAPSKKQETNYHMNKSEFISAIGNRTLKKDSELKPIIDTAITILTETLASGESITIPGFGTFEVRQRAATTARNPRTGETIEVAAKRVPTFKPGKALKDAVDK